MKLLVILLGTIAIVKSATIFHKNVPVEKTSIIGPSGSIKELKNIGSKFTEVLGPSGSIEKEEYSVGDDSSRRSVAYVTSFTGTQKGTTLIQGHHDLSHLHKSGKNDDCDDEQVHNNGGSQQQTVTTQSAYYSPTIVQHSSVPQGKYPPSLNSFLSDVYNHNTITGSKYQLSPQVTTSNNIVHVTKTSSSQSNHVVNIPIDQSAVKIQNVNSFHVINHVPSKIQSIHIAENVAPQVQHNADKPIEKTSIVGPSGSIVQNKYYQVSTKTNNENFSQGNHVVDLPSEKTSIVGPSGSITQEKHFESALNKINGEVHVQKNVLSYIQPAVVTENVLSQGSRVIGSNVKTTVDGPSGTITQEKYYKTSSNKENGLVHYTVKNVPSKAQTVLLVDNLVSQGNRVADLPSEKTSVVGPSGTITQEKHFQAPLNKINGEVQYVQNIAPSYIRPVVVSQGNLVTASNSNTRVEGPSGTITQEQYYKTPLHGDVYYTVKNVPSNTQRVLVVDNAVSQGNQAGIVSIEKTKVDGPSGSITKEQYYQTPLHKENGRVYNVVNSVPSNSGLITQVNYYGTPISQNNAKVYNVVKNVPSNVQNIVVVENAQKTQVLNSPAEKTSIVGPSGKITQEKFYQNSDNNGYGKVYYGVENVPFEVQNIQQSVVSNEKTKVVGPSGSITQERYYPTEKFNKNVKISYVVDSAPGNGNVFITGNNHIVNSDELKGTITEEKYYKYIPNKNSGTTYHLVKDLPVSSKVVVAPYTSSFVENVPVEKTSVIGPSGIITNEKYSNLGDTTTSYSPVSYYSSSSVDETDCDEESDSSDQPSHHSERFPTRISNVVHSYVNSENLAAYGYPSVENIALVYGPNTPYIKTNIVGSTGSVTHVKNSQTTLSSANNDFPHKNVIYVHNSHVEHTPTIFSQREVHYPPIPKYPNIAVTDC